ncbi:MAG: sulfatase-like hydrolase/transferase [Verrucomicrobiota bacterium]
MFKKLLLTILVSGFWILDSAAQNRPNILLLFADDAGYGDFGFHDSHHFQTPHLDQLAASGTIMSQFYVSAATCGPSRAGLLTGLCQQRFGYEENNVPGMMSPSSKLLGDEMGLPTHLETIGDHLQALDYQTAIFGKWHLGIADRYHPLKRGFHEFYGFRGGARSFYPLTERQAADKPENRLERNFANYAEHQGYLTNTLADETCAFIERSHRKEQPFFAFVSFNAVHSPMHIDPHDKDTFPQLKGKRRQAAQMMLSMDRACGQILNKLDQLQIRKNTLVVFTNDNGGPTGANASSNYPFAGVKATHLEGGIRVPALFSWPGKIAPGSTSNQITWTLDLLPTFLAAADDNPHTLEQTDGLNLLPHLTTNTPLAERSLYWKVESRAAVRTGDWKLIRFPDRPPMLFNLANDPTEETNLASQKPQKLKELFKTLFTWEMELERPLFLLDHKAEAWSAQRLDEYRTPPEKTW